MPAAYGCTYPTAPLTVPAQHPPSPPQVPTLCSHHTLPRAPAHCMVCQCDIDGKLAVSCRLLGLAAALQQPWAQGQVAARVPSRMPPALS